MAVVNLKSDLYRDQQAGGAVPDALVVKGIVRRATGKILNGAADSAASTYKIISLPSYVILGTGTLFHNANFGFATTQVGIAGDEDALFTKTTSASTTESPVTGIEAASGVRLWELLGLAEDPNDMIDLIATAAAGATGAGNMPFTIEWIDNG